MNNAGSPPAARTSSAWRTRTVAWGLALLLLLSTAACGDSSTAPDVNPALEGPPRWRGVRDEGPAGDSRLALHCRTPCRVRFRIETSDGRAELLPWRAAAAGQTLQVWWSVAPMPPSRHADLPRPGRLEEGRTEPHAAELSYQYGDRAVRYRRFALWTRPGLGAVHHLEAVPPGTYDPVPASGELELATVAVTDLATGRAVLRRAEPRNRLVLPEEAGEDDRHRILRLFLDVQPVGD